MKKLKIDYVFVAAMVMGGGLAFAGTSASNADTEFYNTATSGTPNWQPVPAGRTVRCDANPDNACKETRDEQGNVTSSQTGNATLI